MKVNKKMEGGRCTIAVEGRLDTSTAGQLESALGPWEGLEELIFDFEGLEYMSSAGIRVLLSAYKAMKDRGSMKLRNVNSEVLSALRITGFADKLVIE